MSFAAIGKGYAADQVKKLWLALGVKSGYISASGDIAAFGKSQMEMLEELVLQIPIWLLKLYSNFRLMI